MYWLKSPGISVKHGFSLRGGGVSPAPFDSLNLGGHEDDPRNIAENRRLALEALDIDIHSIANLKQVHGNEVLRAVRGTQTGDALVTSERGLTLVISVADCYPILFHDPVNQVIGAAHAGWRGTVGRIAANTLKKMEELGADIRHIRIAIGQGICRDNFEVGEEVLARFREQGFPESCIYGRYIDLLEANRFVLLESGVTPGHIWSLNRCTTESDFFSYRRDKGRTGRMWGLISL